MRHIWFSVYMWYLHKYSVCACFCWYVVFCWYVIFWHGNSPSICLSQRMRMHLRITQSSSFPCLRLLTLIEDFFWQFKRSRWARWRPDCCCLSISNCANTEVLNIFLFSLVLLVQTLLNAKGPPVIVGIGTKPLPQQPFFSLWLINHVSFIFHVLQSSEVLVKWWRVITWTVFSWVLQKIYCLCEASSIHDL